VLALDPALLPRQTMTSTRIGEAASQLTVVVVGIIVVIVIVIAIVVCARCYRAGC
jgi:hypothetical protein